MNYSPITDLLLWSWCPGDSYSTGNCLPHRRQRAVYVLQGTLSAFRSLDRPNSSRNTGTFLEVGWKTVDGFFAFSFFLSTCCTRCFIT